MRRNDKNITISLRVNEDTKNKLDSLCQIEKEYYKEKGVYMDPAVNSKMIRCLIDAVYYMPLEKKRELISMYYKKW